MIQTDCCDEREGGRSCPLFNDVASYRLETIANLATYCLHHRWLAFPHAAYN